jgi:UDP-N-acetylglucosamine 2-epimerase (non-hydrolysing)
MSLTQGCAAVVTDSGGYQKEAYYAGKRAVVVMPDTGWRELTKAGWNRLSIPESKFIKNMLADSLDTNKYLKNIFGNGDAGENIVEAILKR